MVECVRILIAEEQPLVRRGLCHLLESEPGFKVVGAVGQVAEAARLLTEPLPHLILLGMGSSAEPPLATIRDLHAAARAVPILLIGRAAPPVPAIILAGARGILRATADPEELFKAIRMVARGEYWVGRGAFHEVIQHLRGKTGNGTNGSRDADGLTPRERQIAVGVSRGESNREIATRLGLAEATVKDYLTAIFVRLGLANRAELSAWATRRTLEDEPAPSGERSGSAR